MNRTSYRARTDGLFGGFLNFIIIGLVLLGAVLLYFAFSVVRAVVFWLLWHMLGIAFFIVLVALAALLVYIVDWDKIW